MRNRVVGAVLLGLAAAGCAEPGDDAVEDLALVRQALTAGQVFEFSVRIPAAQIPENMLLASTESLRLNDRVRVGPTGGSEVLSNFGATSIAAGARVEGSVFANGTVFMGSGSAITRTLTVSGVVTQQNNVTIGTRVNVPSIADRRVTFSVAVPATVGGNVILEPDQTRTLAPGAYGALDVRSRADLFLSSGTYFFESFNLEPQGEIFVNKTAGPIQIYVASSFNFKGAFVQNGGPEANLVVGYAGASQAYIQGPFTGTFIAPNAEIALHRPSNPAASHRGAFFGRRVEVFSDARVLRLPFPWTATLLRRDNRAAGFAWQGVGQTTFAAAGVLIANHTIAARFMPQYEGGFRGVLVGDGGGQNRIGMASFSALGRPGVEVVVRGAAGTFAIPDQIMTNNDVRPGGTCPGPGDCVPVQPNAKWRHLAVSVQGTTASVYLDGALVGSFVTGSGGALGNLRFGRTPFATAPQDQFFGFLDDVAVMNRALTAAEVAALAAQSSLLGNEPGLVAGWTFDDGPGFPAVLRQPFTTTGPVTLQAVSANRNSAADTPLLPGPVTTTAMSLPFERSQVWTIVQGINSTTSHNGIATFTIDFVRVNPSLVASNPNRRAFDPATVNADSDGQPFLAPADGTMSATVECFPNDNSAACPLPEYAPGVTPAPPGSPANRNISCVRTAPGEHACAVHLRQNSIGLADGTAVLRGDEIGLVGRTGTGGEHLHFGMSDIPEATTPGEFTSLMTIPASFYDYFVSSDFGDTWQFVAEGIPTPGQWVTQPCFPDFHNLDARFFQACFDYWNGRGFRPVSLSTYTIDGRVFMAGSFQPGPSVPTRHLLTEADYQAAFDSLLAAGFRPEKVSIVDTSAGRRFTAFWTPIEAAFESRHALTPSEYETLRAARRAQGFLQTDLFVYALGTRIAATWVQVPFTNYIVETDMTSAQLQQRFDERFAQGLFVTHVVGYRVLSPFPVTRFGAIWEARPAANWAMVHDRTSESYQQAYDDFIGDGLRLHQVIGYNEGLFAAIWTFP